MKLISKINPKNLFRSKKTRSIKSRSNSNPSSFSSSSSEQPATPTSVLPPTSADVAHAFKMIDTDGDGKIDLVHLQQLLTRIGPDPPTRTEATLMLTEIDKDNDGCITLEELSAVGSAFDPTAERDELREAFGFFDADRDGRITAEELREVFAAVMGEEEGCTLEECRRMVAEVGKGGSGFVCFEDFVRMMEMHPLDSSD